MIIVSNLSKIVRAVHKSGELLEFLGVLLALANPIREREIGMKRHGQIFIVSVFHSYRCFPFSWQWMYVLDNYSYLSTCNRWVFRWGFRSNALQTLLHATLSSPSYFKSILAADKMNSRPFSCRFPQCNASYQQKEHRHRHEPHHFRDQVFKCTTCHQQFGRK